MEKRLILMLVFIVLFHVVCNRNDDFEIPEIDDPCEIKICRLVEEIVHEEQIPIKVKERK